MTEVAVVTVTHNYNLHIRYILQNLFLMPTGMMGGYPAQQMPAMQQQQQYQWQQQQV